MTCQEWLIHGVSVRRILPTIWVHRWSVSAVACHVGERQRRPELFAISLGKSSAERWRVHVSPEY